MAAFVYLSKEVLSGFDNYKVSCMLDTFAFSYLSAKANKTRLTPLIIGLTIHSNYNMAEQSSTPTLSSVLKLSNCSDSNYRTGIVIK